MEIMGLPPRSFIERSTRQSVFFDANLEPKIVPNSHGKKVRAFGPGSQVRGNPHETCPALSPDRLQRRPGAKDLAGVLRSNDPAFLDFLQGCLRWDPKERLTPDQALNHDWIKESTRKRSIGPTTPSPTNSSAPAAAAAAAAAAAVAHPNGPHLQLAPTGTAPTALGSSAYGSGNWGPGIAVPVGGRKDLPGPHTARGTAHASALYQQQHVPGAAASGVVPTAPAPHGGSIYASAAGTNLYSSRVSGQSSFRRSRHQDEAFPGDSKLPAL